MKRTLNLPKAGPVGLVTLLALVGLGASIACVPTGVGAAVPLVVHANTFSLNASANHPGATTNELNGVACTTAAVCVSAGFEVSGSEANMLIARVGSITLPAANASPGAEATLSAVSCAPTAGAKFCVAVGQFGTSVNGPERPLIELWTGLAWHRVSTAASDLNPGISRDLNGVSCPSVSFCAAVGSFTTASGVRHPLVLQYAAGTWTRIVDASGLSVGLQGGLIPGDSWLNAVSCATTTFCEAVGSAGHHDLVEKFAGTAWSHSTSPSPSITPGSGGEDELLSVSCRSSLFCDATGWKVGFDNSGSYILAYRGVNAPWSIQMPASAGSLGFELAGIACPSFASCVAVGDFVSATAVNHTLAETWSSTTNSWHVDPAWNGPGANDLNGVFCKSTSDCIAVGTRDYPTKTLVETGP